MADLFARIGAERGFDEVFEIEGHTEPPGKRESWQPTHDRALKSLKDSVSIEDWAADRPSRIS